jgi:iron only hydrogenase large subunit-like protein
MDNIPHSVKLVTEKCTGCTKCMINCPVEAVRLKNNRAVIYADKCIDCGECIRVCPYGAHVAERESLNCIDGYKIKIAIPSVTLYAQFGSFVNPNIINDAIKSLGFDEVYDTTYACDVVAEITRRQLYTNHRPSLSSFCPAITRLIHTSYPELSNNLVSVMAPIEVAANLIREKYETQGYKQKETGVFFISPCASWHTQINSSYTKNNAPINGSIAISDIYSQLLKYINKSPLASNDNICPMSSTGLGWAELGGQAKAMRIKDYMTVDGIKKVIKILDEVERGRYDDLPFIELAACTGGCLGGIHLIDNPYNSSRIVRKYCRYLNYTSNILEFEEKYENAFKSEYPMSEYIGYRLAEDFDDAVIKMNYMNKLINILPGTDCGLCGSPSCKAFAEDVVRGLAQLHECKLYKGTGGENK